MNKLKHEAKEGPNVLLTVKRVILRQMPHHGLDVYTIHFDGGATLGTTNYHSFVSIRDGVEILLQPKDLMKDDLVWVDKVAFLGDGSLTVNPPKGFANFQT